MVNFFNLDSYGNLLQDERSVHLKMLARAVSDAKEKVAIMAEAAGWKLGRIISINYNHSNIHMESQARNIHSNLEAKSSSSSSLNITPDDLLYSDCVEAEWELINS